MNTNLLLLFVLKNRDHFINISSIRQNTAAYNLQAAKDTPSKVKANSNVVYFQ